MNLVGRFLLSSSVYHLRAVASVPGLPGDLGYEVIVNPDGSITVGGEAPAGSEIVVTWPDGGVVEVIVDETGSWSETSPPGQPEGEAVVSMVWNFVQFADGAFEQFADGSFVVPELNLVTSAILLDDGGFEITDSGEYIYFEFE
nr:hypothetical protein [Pseudomonas sp. s4]